MELSPLSHIGFNADNDGDQLHVIPTDEVDEDLGELIEILSEGLAQYNNLSVSGGTFATSYLSLPFYDCVYKDTLPNIRQA